MTVPGRRPLAGKRVLITRAREQAGRLQLLLEARGAEVIAIPAIAIVPPDSYEQLDAALAEISIYDWLVLTSANTVAAVAERAEHLGPEIRRGLRGMDGRLQIAAIGAATAEAARDAGWRVDLVPPRAVAESLAAGLAPKVQGKRVLLARAKVGREVLREELRRAGASVTAAVAYQTVIPVGSAGALQDALGSVRGLDAVLFTSGSSVANLVALCEAAGMKLPDQVKRISIGPITSKAIGEQGWNVDAEAKLATMEALAEACEDALMVA